MARRGWRRVLSVVGLTFLMMVSLCGTVWATARAPRTVLAIHWSTEDFPSSALTDATIRNLLTADSNAPIDYNAEYLESDRFPEEQAMHALRDYIKEKFEGRRIELVIAIAEPALEFALRFRGDLFPDAPIVYSGLSERPPQIRNEGGGLTGVLSGAGYAATAALALKLHPLTEQVFIVAQAPNYDLEELVRADLRSLRLRVRLTFIREAETSRLVASVRAVPGRSVILYVRSSYDEPAKVLTPTQMARLVGQASPVPVYGVWSAYIESGVVGGIVPDVVGIATKVANMARRILDGTPAQDIPVEHAAVVPMFDWRELRRWGISERSLPAGSVVLFRSPSIWEQYWPAIIGILSVLVLQSALIVALLFERRTRRRSQRALRESEERVEIAGVTLGVGFWTWEPESDRVWTTRQCAWLLDSEIGRPLPLRTFLDALRPQIGEPAEDAFERAIRSGMPFDGEWPIRHHGGPVRWIAAAVRPSADSRGRRPVTGVLLDVTDRKNGELVSAEQRRELAHLNRVAMLGEVSGVLAHELRQPLMAIRGYAQGSLRLIDNGDRLDTTKVREGLEAIVRAEERADVVIERARTLLKRSDPQMKEVDVNDLVRETLELASIELDARAVSAVTLVDGDQSSVLGDRIELEQVLMNLLLNACDAMAGIAPARRTVTLTTRCDADHVQILVRDAGTGIAPDCIDRLFEPFVTTKRDGLGLGLAICRSIVQAHRGTIQAVNHPEGGSTFQVFLPRARNTNPGSSMRPL